jgi:hypothetical protein
MLDEILGMLSLPENAVIDIASVMPGLQTDRLRLGQRLVQCDGQRPLPRFRINRKAIPVQDAKDRYDYADPMP